jgi:hypothetical protein
LMQDLAGFRDNLLRHLQTEGPGSLKTPGAFAYNTDKT